jgi:hypothetical protein
VPDLTSPAAIARGIAAARIGIGAAAVLAPRPLLRLGTGAEPSPVAAGALRMVGGRDIALGLGLLLGMRRRPASGRGWLEAGLLADAVDLPAMLGMRDLKPAVRAVSALAAATGTASQLYAARTWPHTDTDA